MTISRSDAGEVRVVRIVAAILLDGAGKTLLVRKRGTAVFMQPGGKKCAGESSLDALTREMEEELGLGLEAERFAALGTFRAPAANEPGWTVEAELYAARSEARIRVAAEIEEAIWVEPSDCGGVVLAPLTQCFALPMAVAIGRSRAG